MSKKDKQKESWSNRCNESGRLTGGFSKYKFLELERLIGSFKIRKMTSMWYFYWFTHTSIKNAFKIRLKSPQGSIFRMVFPLEKSRYSTPFKFSPVHGSMSRIRQHCAHRGNEYDYYSGRSDSGDGAKKSEQWPTPPPPPYYVSEPSRRAPSFIKNMIMTLSFPGDFSTRKYNNWWL